LSLDTQNFDLAKKYANKSFIDQKLKKNLWIKIARKILSSNENVRGKKEDNNEENVRKVLELLNETKDILRIDDLLPYFPDNTKVETLKEKLCDSFRSYNEFEIRAFRAKQKR